MTDISTLLHHNNHIELINSCIKNDHIYLGLLFTESGQVDNITRKKLIDKIYSNSIAKSPINSNINSNININTNINTNININSVEQLTKKKIRIMPICNWLPSKDLCILWNKMSKGSFCWNNLQLTWIDKDIDYYVIINSTDQKILSDIPHDKIIYFCMEPFMEKRKNIWGIWCDPPKTLFFRGVHQTEYNNNEWHLSWTYNDFCTRNILKNNDVSNVLSAIVSDKYIDPGHIKRIDFLKFLETKNDINVDIYGNNKFKYKNYKGQLPYHEKDNGIFPYKYTFNVENHDILNYYTEKLIDGILGETLVFYHGCPNIRNFIDERAFVWLELENFEQDYEIIKKAISEDLWSKRIEYIRKMKYKILNELQFFPRLERIISKK